MNACSTVCAGVREATAPCMRHVACMHATAQVRAMGASGLQFTNPPKGFWSAALVPYSQGPGIPALDPAAAIHHLSNKYCGENTQKRIRGRQLKQVPKNWERRLQCTVPVESFFHTSSLAPLSSTRSRMATAAAVVQR